MILRVLDGLSGGKALPIHEAGVFCKAWFCVFVDSLLLLGLFSVFLEKRSKFTCPEFVVSLEDI